MGKSWCLTWLLIIGATSWAYAVENQQQALDPVLVKKIETFNDPVKLQQLTTLANDIAKKYTSDSFLHQIMYADQIRLEKIRAYNNQLLYEFPLYSLEKVLVPRIGLYVKDLYELLFWGSEIAFDIKLKGQFSVFLADRTFDYLTHLDEKTLMQFLDDQNQEQSDDARIAAHKKTEQWLTDLAHRSLQFPFALLKRKEMVQMMMQSITIDCVIALLRSSYLVKDHAAQNPVPLFSLLEKHILAGIFFHSTEMSTLAFISNFIKKQGLPNHFLSESFFVRGLGAFACLIYFMRWMTHHFLIPQWKTYLIEHQASLKKMLRAHRCMKQNRLCPGGDQGSQLDRRQASEIKEQEKCLKETLKHFIAEGQTISLTTWVRYKQQKYTQWDFGSTLLLSLPGLYQFGKKIYHIYTAFVEKQSEQVGEQRS